MYEIVGPLNTRRFLGLSTNYAHVYYTSQTAKDLGGALLEALHAGAKLSTPRGSATLDGVVLPGADLRNAQLAGCSMRRANFHGCNLSGANLRGNLDGADLSEANLTNSVLGRMRNANLAGSNLSGVSLVYEMYGANLDRANVRGARVADWLLGHVDFTRCLHLGHIEVVEGSASRYADNFSWVDGLDVRNAKAISRARAAQPT